MASGRLSQGCPPKAAVGAQRLILEAVKTKEVKPQEGSWDGGVLGSGAAEGSLPCATGFFRFSR